MDFDFEVRAKDVFNAMAPRVVLQDGRLGYRIRAEAELALALGANYDMSEQRETIAMVADEAHVVIEDPMLQYDGTMRINLEILSFTLRGISRSLFGTDVPIEMKCGRFADTYRRPTFGYVDIQKEVRFGESSVPVIHQVYVTVDTPMGVLHNFDPALMEGSVTALPPIGSVYTQKGSVTLFDSLNNVAAVKATQMSRIVENLDAPT